MWLTLIDMHVMAADVFMSYRAKAGGRQSAKDATGKSIKSAGSALRRHNEVSIFC